MTGDAFAQRRYAEGRDVAYAIRIKRRTGRGQRPFRGRRTGLADLKMDDGVAASLLLGSRRHDIHYNERIDGAGPARQLSRNRPSP